MEPSHANAVLNLFYDVASTLPLGWGSPAVWGPQQVAVTMMNLLRPGTMHSYKTCLPELHAGIGQERWGWTRAPDPRGLSDARMRCGTEPLVACAQEAINRAVAMAAACAADQRGLLGRSLAAFDGTDLLLFEDPGTRHRFGGRNQSEREAGRPTTRVDGLGMGYRASHSAGLGLVSLWQRRAGGRAEAVADSQPGDYCGLRSRISQPSVFARYGAGKARFRDSHDRQRVSGLE